MTINFDVISDLNLKSLNDFSWEGKATSLFCIIAGNISSNHDILFDFLEHLAQYYEAVFFLDGDLEHDEFEGDFDRSYSSLRQNIDGIDKVVFLHENIVVLNNAAILGTNGWTTFNFVNEHALDENIRFLEDRGMVPEEVSTEIFKMSITDQHYMYNSVASAQTMPEVQNLIIVTNSIPKTEFVLHDKEYAGTILGDTSGNNGITDCLENDTEGKISTWIFGKYHGDLDYTIDGIRYVNNPGSKDLSIYYPKIIKI
jgi:hypothetical protein